MNALMLTLLLWLVLLLPATGCVSKSEARMQARMAFLAGQQQAWRQQQMSRQNDGKNGTKFVVVNGPVHKPHVPWTEHLTLSQALVLAEYDGLGDPRVILVNHRGQVTTVDPSQLLARKVDPTLEPGDIVDLVQ